MTFHQLKVNPMMIIIFTCKLIWHIVFLCESTLRSFIKASWRAIGYNRCMQLEDELGDIISKARQGLGLSVSQLTNKASIPEHDINAIEAYRLTPGRDSINRLANALGLNAHKLAPIADRSWTPAQLHFSSERLIVEQVFASFGNYKENAYIVGCAESCRGIVVDPGGAVDEIEHYLNKHKLILEIILISHAHADHILGLRELTRKHPTATVVCSAVDRGTIMRGINARCKPIEDGTIIAFDGHKITAIATPGHTPGSMCYVLNGICFVGDTLFAGSIGRPTCDYPQMLEAIRSKILTLPDSTILLPGHGPATTAGEENRHNPFF